MKKKKRIQLVMKTYTVLRDEGSQHDHMLEGNQVTSAIETQLKKLYFLFSMNCMDKSKELS